MIDSLSLGPQKTPKKNAADEEDGSSHRRIKTVFEQSSVIYPILAPEFYTQGDGRKVATCTIPISSDVADVKGFIDTDRRTVRWFLNTILHFLRQSWWFLALIIRILASTLPMPWS
jgi:hypothetical protein